MRSIFLLSIGIAAGLGTLASAPLAAQEQVAANEDGAREQNSGNTISCRRMAAPTGTRIGPRRICKTDNEWELMEQEARGVVENIGSRNRAGSGN